MTKYGELKQRFKTIGLGVVKIPYVANGRDGYQVYFLGGIQKGGTLANVTGLESLERLAKINHV